MLTTTDLQQLREFLSDPDSYSNVYGAITLPGKGKENLHGGGALILNNKGDKPINYFLCDTPTGTQINGTPFTDYTDLILTKKHRISQQTQTIVLPLKKTI